MTMMYFSISETGILRENLSSSNRIWVHLLFGELRLFSKYACVRLKNLYVILKIIVVVKR